MSHQDPLIAMLSDDRMALMLHQANKDALLAELARRAASLTGVSETPLRKALVIRETLGSTGFGAGIAVPHARIDGLDDPFCFFVRLDKPISFDAIDGKPVDLVFLLLTPSAQSSAHLTLLATIAKRLRRKSVADALRHANDPAQVRQALLEF